MTAPSKLAAARASERLVTAIADAASRGLTYTCSDPSIGHLWLSEDADERAQAAKLCIGCVIQAECWSVAHARRERFGTWGGHDFTPRRYQVETSP
jgi:hypothetical protein